VITNPFLQDHQYSEVTPEEEMLYGALNGDCPSEVRSGFADPDTVERVAFLSEIDASGLSEDEKMSLVKLAINEIFS